MTRAKERVVRAAIRWWRSFEKKGMHMIPYSTWRELELSCAAISRKRKTRRLP
jgi:hypothetical protein